MSRSGVRRRVVLASQIALALVLTAVLVVAVWWGYFRETTTVENQGTSVELDFTGLPDGPVPDNFDGRPAVNVSDPAHPGADFRILGGRMTFQPTLPNVAAAYYSTPDLGAAVRSMGMTFTFRPGAGSLGAIAMVVSRGIEDTFPPLIRPLPIHFVLTPINWNIAVSRAGNAPLERIAAGDLPQPLLEDGVTEYEARLTISGDDVTIELPGVRQTVSDPRISEWRGDFATFELFSNNGLTDSIGAFSKIWASATGDGP